MPLTRKFFEPASAALMSTVAAAAADDRWEGGHIRAYHLCTNTEIKIAR